jgi:hypothetical protein
VASVDGFVLWAKTAGKSEGAKIDWLEELASFDWKSLNSAVLSGWLWLGMDSEIETQDGGHCPV